jgi:hypothetical protein
MPILLQIYGSKDLNENSLLFIKYVQDYYEEVKQIMPVRIVCSIFEYSIFFFITITIDNDYDYNRQ